jgi:hypothetical protein
VHGARFFTAEGRDYDVGTTIALDAGTPDEITGR